MKNESNESEKTYPLTAYQKDIWLQHCLYPGETLHTIGGYLIMEGDLCVPCFMQAIREVTIHEEAIRITIGRKEQVPFQKFSVLEDIPIEYIDYAGAEDGLDRCLEAMENSFQIPFDLYGHSLFEYKLFKVNGQQYYCFVKFHHIIMDGWGASVFFRRLADTYNRIMEKGENAEGKNSYIPFIREHLEYLESSKYKDDAGFWKKKLSVLPENSLFEQNGTERTGCDSRKPDIIMIPRKLYDKMTAYAINEGSGVFHFMIGILLVYFDKLFPNDTSVIGLPILNRKEKYKDTIGLFVNLIPLSLDIDRTESFGTLLQNIRKNLMLSYRHAEYPYGDMLASAFENQESKRPFDIMFSYEKYNRADWFKGLKVSAVPMDHKHHKNPLTVFVKEHNGSEDVRMEFCYGMDWFDNNFDTRRMIDNIKYLIYQILENTSAKIADLKIQTPEEKDYLIHQLNQTGLKVPDFKNIHSVFSKQVKKLPDRIAAADEERSLTYRELDEQSDLLAAVLLDKGVKNGRVIGLLMDRTVDMIIGMLGILKAGGAYLPLDLEAPFNRISYMLKESNALCIVTKESMGPFGEWKQPMVFLDRIGGYEPGNRRLAELWDVMDYKGVKAFIDADNRTGPKNLAYIIYTSGTSGKPKGVMIEHGNVINLVYALHERIFKSYHELLHFSMITPYFFDVSVGQIFTPLLLGHSLYIASEETRLSGERMLAFYDKFRIDIAEGTPTHMQIILHALEASHSPLHVKRFILGGESLTYKLAKDLKKYGGCSLEVSNIYGPTECCVLTTVHHVKEDAEGMVPIGIPIGNTSAYVLNPHLEPVPVGVMGELYLGGSCVGRGYLNNKELTDSRFIENPFVTGQKMYKTGDLARWNELGELEFLGRADGQVKIRGHRIELDEISNQLLKINGIEKAVAVIHEDSDDTYICAYLVGDKKIDREAMIHELSEELPNYMIPSYFVWIAALPMNHNGKLDKKALPDPRADYNLQAESNEDSYREVEKGVQQIFKDILSLDNVNKRDNFFHLGGHSVKAMYLSSEIEKKFQVRLPLKEIFDHPTIEQLGYLIENSKKSIFVPIPAAAKKEYYPLSYPQKQMFIMSQIKDCDITYNIPSVYSIEGELDKDKLLAALEQLIARHEVLRTSFAEKNGAPVQMIADQVSFRLEILNGDGGDMNNAVRKFIRPFDLSKAPLMRAGILERDSSCYFLLLDFHHIILDGTSAEIFMNELMTLYQGGSLKEQSVRYRDFVEWEEGDAFAEEKKRHKEYWIAQYSPDIPVLDLPGDYPRPARQKYEGERIFFQLKKEDAEELKKLADKTGVSIYMILFAQYNILLSKYARQDDILVGTPISGRRHPNLQNVLGMFVSTVGIRSFPKADKTFSSFLKEVQEKVMQAYEHPDYRLEEIVSELNIKRDMSRSSVFNTAFSWNTTVSHKFESDKLMLEACYFDFPISKFDLTVTGREREGVFHFDIEYSTAIFKKETMQRFAKHFLQVIKETLERPYMTLGEIQLMTAEERRQMLRTTVCGRRIERKQTTVFSLFEEQVKQAPDRIAFVHLNKKMSYRELNRQVDLMAYGILLRRHKDHADRKIAALLFHNSIELAAGMLACLKEGIAFLPIDPDYPVERIVYMLKDSQAFAVMTTKKLYQSLQEGVSDFSRDFFMLTDDIADSDMSEVDRQGKLYELEEQYSKDRSKNAYIIYTSGSTGQPKGVMVGPEAFLNFCLWFQEYYKVTKEDRTTKYAGAAFDASLCEVFPYLICGAAIHIIDDDLKYNLDKLNQYYEEQQISISFLPTQSCEQFMKMDNKSLRILLTGGEKLKQYVPKNYQLVNNYGPTEAAIMATAHKVHEMEYNIPIGRPVDNTDIYILGECDSLMPAGIPGELCIAGMSLANGYLNQPGLTKEKFVPNPFRKGERMYRTGDLARYLENGEIEYLGRIDSQVKIRGYRIELGEIEHKIKEIEGIDDAAVAVKEIQNKKVITAYLVIRDEDVLKGLMDILNKSLPAYMIPSAFVCLPRIPLTPNGKVDERALPLPAIEESVFYEPPRNDEEEKIAAIWKKVLNVERVGIRDNFFELGGDSVLMMNVLSQLNQKGLQVSAKYFMDNPTIVSLSEMAAKTAEKTEDIKVVEGSVPLLPNRSMLDRRNKGNNVNHWNLGLLFEVSPVPDASDLDKVIQFLYRHHDGLRLRIRKGAEGWEQEIRSPKELFSVDEIDLSHIQGENQKEEIERLAEWYQQHITLDEEPVKAALFHLGDRQPGRILIIIHHAMIDGYSAMIFLEDFVHLYWQMMKKEELKLPQKTTSLKEWSEYLVDYAQTSDVCEDAQYWLDIPDRIESIPCDHPKEQENNFFKYERSCRGTLCSIEETKKIHSAIIKNNLQFNSVFLTAMASAIKDWARHSNFLIDYTLNGRYPICEEIDLSRTLGWLAYLVPIHLDVHGDDILSDVKRVSRKLEKLPKGGLSYGCLRYLSENEELRDGMEKIPNPLITYNYFRKDKNEREELRKYGSLIRYADENPGSNEGNNISRGRLLDFVVEEDKGALFLRIHYSCNIHEENTIRMLWNNMKRNLYLILECL